MKTNIWKIENIVQLRRDHCRDTGEYRGAVHSICNLKHSVPKKIPTVFHNVSYFDYYFFIKELVEEFKKRSICLGENTDEYITFTVPTEEVARIDKNGEEITEYICYSNVIRTHNHLVRKTNTQSFSQTIWIKLQIWCLLWARKTILTYW